MALQDVEVTPLDPARFRDILPPQGLAQFERAIVRGRRLLANRVFWNVNSTARGGGVAEMLRSLIGYACGAGLDARWVTIGGDEDFFRVTKRLHNRLHGFAGDGGPLGDAERAVYERRSAENADLFAQRLGPSDVVLLHDPQTAGMVAPLVEKGVPVIWRAHVGLDVPNDRAREAWQFLLGYVSPADAYVFSRPGYTWEGLEEAKVSVIPPSIDAFSPKNHAMSFTSVTAVLRAAGLGADHHHRSRAIFERLDGSVGRVEHAARLVEDHALRLDVPLVAQVSRWDRLKDPMGIVSAFAECVHADEDPHLLLAGPDVTAVADDPEGAEVFEEVEAAWHGLPQRVRRRVHLALLPMDEADENAVIVNALQRRADVVVQKSLAEGFGLTVAEAMWKARPVVGSRVGGIQDQIADGESGLLVDPVDARAFGDAVARLLRDTKAAKVMGQKAHERAAEEYLADRYLVRWMELAERAAG